MGSLLQVADILHMDFKDIGTRAAKTAVQCFGAQVVASGLGVFDFVQDASLLEKGGLAALGGAAAVVWNALINWSSSK